MHIGKDSDWAIIPKVEVGGGKLYPKVRFVIFPYHKGQEGWFVSLVVENIISDNTILHYPQINFPHNLPRSLIPRNVTVDFDLFLRPNKGVSFDPETQTGLVVSNLLVELSSLEVSLDKSYVTFVLRVSGWSSEIKLPSSNYLPLFC